MDPIYYAIYGMLLLLSVFGLKVGVSNDAANFLNSSIGCKAGSFYTVVAVAAVGVLLGASFSSGMMEVARSGVFNPRMFNFHEVMLLFLAVMISNVILLDVYNTLGLPTSTTISLVFALLGSSIGMAVYSKDIATDDAPLAAYINTSNAFAIVVAIFVSVVIAFTLGSCVMWFARLLFSFRYKRAYRYIGPLWCGSALTAITYFAIFKGLRDSSMLSDETKALLNADVGVTMAWCWVAWLVIMAFLQYVCRVNTLRIAVLSGTGALALAFAGNDLVNFIGVFMAAQTSLDIAGSYAGDVSNMMMGELAATTIQANPLYLLTAGLIMVASLFFSKNARKVTETELKLSSSNTGKERFGSSLAARVMVRYALNTARFIEKVTPRPVAEFVGRRFAPLPPEEETGTNYDLVRGSVNLTTAALLISIATSMKMPLSTTYVTFMVAMGSSLADRAWGRDSAVYRITGVLTVTGGWFLTAIGACLASFCVALVLAYGGVWAQTGMMLLALALLVRSALLSQGAKKEYRILDVSKDAQVREYGAAAAGRLGRMVGIYNAMVKALLTEDRETLKSLRKKTRSMKQDLKLVKENEVLPSLPNIPPEQADRGQLIYRIIEISLSTCECLLVLVKASYNHIDNNHTGLNKEQAKDLLALTGKIWKFYPNLTDMLKAGDFAGIDKMLEGSDQLGDDFAECITRHLTQNANDESSMRTGILYLTLLNETRAMVSHAFALIRRIMELYKG